MNLLKFLRRKAKPLKVKSWEMYLWPVNRIINDLGDAAAVVLPNMDMDTFVSPEARAAWVRVVIARIRLGYGC